MATKKSTATKKNPENPETPIQVIKEASCKSLEGSATLTYQIGNDETSAIQFRIDKNSGSGFFSDEWVAFDDIQAAFKAWGTETPITSMALRPIFRGKSVNTPSFMLAVLSAEGLLEPMPKRKRVHRATDPGPFLASLDQGGRVAVKAKPKSRAKAKAKPKTASKGTAKTAVTPKKTPAKPRKKR
jgi:hypothetical protein